MKLIKCLLVLFIFSSTQAQLGLNLEDFLIKHDLDSSSVKLDSIGCDKLVSFFEDYVLIKARFCLSSFKQYYCYQVDYINPGLFIKALSSVSMLDSTKLFYCDSVCSDSSSSH